MAPLLFLVITTVVVHIVGRIWLPSWRPIPVAIRAGVSVMFLVTGISHFVGMRQEMIGMVPPSLPAPAFLVTLTGVLELAGAMALFYKPLRIWAASGLGLMLICMFPANVHKALSGGPLPWEDTLVPRTIMQVVYLAAVVIVLVAAIRSKRLVATTSREAPSRRPQFSR